MADHLSACCAQCQASLAAGALRCWLCGAELAYDVAPPDPRLEGHDRAVRQIAHRNMQQHRERMEWQTRSPESEFDDYVSTSTLVVGLLAAASLVLGLLFDSWLLAAAFVLLAAPATLGAAWGIVRMGTARLPPVASGAQVLILLLAAMAGLLALAVAAFVALFVVCGSMT